MNSHGDFRNGHDRGSSLFPYVGVQGDRDGSADDFPDDRFGEIVCHFDATPATRTMTTDLQQIEADAQVAISLSMILVLLSRTSMKSVSFVTRTKAVRSSSTAR